MVTKRSQDPRVTMRRAGSPDPDRACVVYWKQRSRRGIDNPVLDVAVDTANALCKPVVVFLAPQPFCRQGEPAALPLSCRGHS